MTSFHIINVALSILNRYTLYFNVLSLFCFCFFWVYFLSTTYSYARLGRIKKCCYWAAKSWWWYNTTSNTSSTAPAVSMLVSAELKVKTWTNQYIFSLYYYFWFLFASFDHFFQIEEITYWRFKITFLFQSYIISKSTYVEVKSQMIYFFIIPWFKLENVVCIYVFIKYSNFGYSVLRLKRKIM